MSALNNIRRFYHVLGYDENKNGCHVLPLIIILISIPLSSGSFLYVFHNKGKQDATGTTMLNVLMATKDIDIIFTIISFVVVGLLSSKSINNLLLLINKKHPSYYTNFSEPQKGFVNHSKIVQNNDLVRTGKTLTIMCISHAFIPGLAGIFLILKEGSKVDFSNLKLPMSIWYPKNYDTVESYIIILILQMTFLSYSYAIAYFMFGSVSSAFQSAVIDMKLFCIDLGDLDKIFKGCKDSHLILRDYMKYLIRCHQQIRSQVKLLSDSVSWVVTLSNQTICFQLCINLYSAVEVQNTASKITFGFLIVAVSLLLFAYCRNGQEIINSNEEIRRCLYECSWLDKPLWFKKDLQIMMAIANVSLHIKPFGIYILGFNSFSAIINASYSYFNVFRTAKSKKS